MIENTCSRGGECPFAHSIEEILYHPLFYKMIICENYRKGVCDTYYCPYVHGLAERRRPSEYKLPFTTGIDIPPLPFVTVVSRIEKKKDNIVPTLEASLASTTSPSDGAPCSPQTERTDCNITTSPKKYVVFSRDRPACTGQEVPAGRWRKTLGRSSSRRSGGGARRDFQRKGSLPSHLSGTPLQPAVVHAPTRIENSLLEGLEPVAEEVGNQSEDFLDACKKRYVDAFTKGYADTSVRSFADAFAKGHVDACVKRYADVHGETSAIECTEDDAATKNFSEGQDPGGHSLNQVASTAAAAAADLFPTSFLPASPTVGLMGHEMVLSSNLLEGDLTTEALAPFVSVSALQTKAAGVVSSIPHAQLVAAALELYDKSTANVSGDEAADIHASALKDLLGRSRGTGSACARNDTRHLTVHQDTSRKGRAGDSSTDARMGTGNFCKGEFDTKTDNKNANCDNCQAGDFQQLVGKVEDVSPTACSSGSSCWLPFLSPCIVSSEASGTEPLTARVRAAGADVLEKLFAGAGPCTKEASVGRSAGETSVHTDTNVRSSHASTPRRLPLPPGIPVPSLLFSAPSQHSGAAGAARLHNTIHADCCAVPETTHDKCHRANDALALCRTRASNMQARDMGAFNRRCDTRGGLARGDNTLLGQDNAADEARERQTPQEVSSATSRPQDERCQTFCETQVTQEEEELTREKTENAHLRQGHERKRESGQGTHRDSYLARSLLQEPAAEQNMGILNCRMLKNAEMRRMHKGLVRDEQEETEREEEEEELLSDEAEQNNRTCRRTHWRLTGATGSSVRLSKPMQERDVHVMERDEGTLSGDDCGCPLAESVLQSLEKSVTLLTTTGWKGSVKQLKRMQKAAGELWELINCGHFPSQAEVASTSSPDPFSELFSFLDSVGGDYVSQRCTTALSALLPGKAQSAEK